MDPMRSLLVVTALLLAGCGAGTDDAAVTTAPPVSVADVSTTSTSPIETTTTSVATTTTTAAPPPTAPAGTIEVRIAGSEVTVEGPTSVSVGDTVVIRVVSDVEDEVHVHTYDLVAPVGPDLDAAVEFVADIPGIHEVELEGAGLRLFDLEVG